MDRAADESATWIYGALRSPATAVAGMARLAQLLRVGPSVAKTRDATERKRQKVKRADDEKETGTGVDEGDDDDDDDDDDDETDIDEPSTKGELHST